jgi:hypothetical protein
VPSGASVRVHDDLSAREAGVAHRTAGDELSGRVDEDEVALLEPPLVVEVAGQDRVENVLDDVRLDERVYVESVAMLGRDEHARYLDRALVSVLVDLVSHRHLALAVGAKVRKHLRLSHLGEPLADPVRERDREGHELFRLDRRVAEHHSLVARADPVERIVVARIVLHLVRLVDSLSDVRRLLVDRDDDPARLGVEAVLGPVVADLADPPADEPRDVDVGLGRYLARDDDEPGCDERLAGDAAGWIVREHRIEHGVGDLVGDLVGVAFRHRLRREEELAHRHGGQG